MSGWYGNDNPPHISRPRRGILVGTLEDLVAYCIGPRPAQAPQLSPFRVWDLWLVQAPGFLYASDAFSIKSEMALVVHKRAFRAWARRNRTRFYENRAECWRREQFELMASQYKVHTVSILGDVL